jgi:hypothetical protein
VTAVRDPIWDGYEFEPDPASAFGQMLSAVEVEEAIAQCIRVWWRDYLAEAERQRGLPVERMPTFRSIVAGGVPERFPEDQLPAVLVTSPGLEPAGGLEVHGDGWFVVRWRIDCTAEISARGNREAVWLARIYAAMLHSLVVQQVLRAPSSPPAWLRGVTWRDEDFTVRAPLFERTRCAGRARFIIETADVVNRHLGPRTPQYRPTGEDEPAEPFLMGASNTVHIRVDKTEEE